ncbi:MAG: SAF domain-containing protein, partial [Acidimicrobiales bacterium]
LVLVAAADLEPGAVVGPSDVRAVELADSGGLPVVAADEQAAVVGQVSRGPIPAGTVLNPGLVTSPGAAVPAGQAIVGASLEPGAAGGTSIAAGDVVRALGAEPNPGGLATARGATAATVLAEGRVWSVEPPTSGSAGRLVITVSVPEDEAAAVAQAAADGRLRLIRVNG